MKFRFPFAAISLTLMAMLSVAQEPTPPQKAKEPATKTPPVEKTAKASLLEELIDKTLKNHPDMRLGAAKVRSAEAKVQEAREELAVQQQKLATQVTAAFGEAQAARETVRSVKGRVDIARDAQRRGVGSQLELIAEEANLARFQAELEYREAVLKALTEPLPAKLSSQTIDADIARNLNRIHLDIHGTPLPKELVRDGGSILLSSLKLLQDSSDPHSGWMNQNCQTCHAVSLNERHFDFAVSKTSASMNDQLRNSLNKPIKLDRSTQGSLEQVLATLCSIGKIDVPFRVIGITKSDSVTLEFAKEPLPLGAWLQMIEDTLQVRFVVREYGILVTNRDRVPEGAVFLQAFWKHKEGTHSEKKEELKKTQNVPDKN